MHPIFQPFAGKYLSPIYLSKTNNNSGMSLFALTMSIAQNRVHF